MEQVKVDPKWALAIPGNLAIRKQVLPFVEHLGSVHVACCDLKDSASLQAVERYVGKPIVPTLADPDSLERAIQRIFQEVATGNGNTSVPVRTSLGPAVVSAEEETENAVSLSDEIFHAALVRNATDVHIEPGSSETRIRLRVDGALETYREVPQSIHAMLISRLKVLCGMDIAERRAPQDGRYSLPLEGDREIDVRAASIPTKFGERMTMRLLAINDRPFQIGELGLAENDRHHLMHEINRPNGLILVTGPTGCGKSTTLYAAIRELVGNRSLNVMTIEDPVECLINGISQIEVDSNDKISFHKALRSLLRHDPDVLMIGEIRDEITAETAIKAALTGHLVFSTLHANSALGSITRLMDMQVRPYLIGTVLQVAIAQRLVRKLCQRCRKEVRMSGIQAQMLGQPELKDSIMYAPGGCTYCAGSGHVGRLGLFEFVFLDGDLSRLVANQASETSMSNELRQRGVPALLDDAIKKLHQGLTSFEQVATIINPF